MASQSKVFCIGFQKTGTTSLYAALTTLGYRTAAVVGRELSVSELKEKALHLCLDAAKTHDAAQDMPWPLFFRELDNAFPGSRFILTLRDADRWFASLEGHFGDEPHAMQEFTYGVASASGNRDRFVATYESHNASVRDYFKDRPDDLLIMDLEDGDGWDALCPFLDARKPETPFPVKNRTSDRKTLLYRLRRRLAMATGRYLAPEQI